MLLKLPGLPQLPDLFGRIELPRDLEAATTRGAEADPAGVGMTEAQVERIWRSGVNLYRSGVHPGLALCVRRHGEVVLNRAIGHARGNGPKDGPDVPKVPMTPDTPTCIFSASKALTALVIHKLCERGVLDLEQRVTDFLPEYGRHGKGHTTIAHVLSHRAAVPALPQVIVDSIEELTDPAQAVEAICDSRPFIRPGTLLAYHAITGGLILGAVAERATGQTVRELLADWILEPLGFRWTNYGVAPEDADRVALNYLTGPKLLPPASTLTQRALGVSIDRAVGLSNQPNFLDTILPSANVFSSADELSRFFEIFRRGGELDGVRVMEEATLRRALTQQSHLEIDLTLGFPTRFSYGLMLGAKVVSPFGLDTDLAFGHLGLINIMGWADPERAISVALVNTGKAIVYPEVHRFLAVMQTITSTVPKVPERERPF